MRDKKDIRHIALPLLMVALLVTAALPALQAEDTTAAAAVKKTEEAKAVEAKAAAAQETTEAKPRLEIYGAAMLDMGYETGISDPNWFDVARPSKLPSSQAQADSWGKDGHWFMGVRQSRLGFKGYLPTKLGEI